MPYLFVCPHCGTKTQVEDQYSGHRGRCVSCDGKIEVPEFSKSPDSSNGLDAVDQTISTIFTRNNSIRWIAGTVVCLVLAGGLLTILVRLGGNTITTLNVSRANVASIKNLEKIAAALNAYAVDHGSYPLPFTTDANNKPMHSWRVSILPYLDEQDLYDRITQTLPWDDPSNRMATDYQIPSCYRDATGDSFGDNVSHYYLITGTETLFPPSGPLRPGDIMDPPAMTILIVEGMPTQFPMSWTEPADLNVSSATTAPTTVNSMTSEVADGLNFATVDGVGHHVGSDLPQSILDALVTPAGGERLPDDTLD